MRTTSSSSSATALEGVSWWVGAVVLAGSGLVAGAARAQDAGPARAPREPAEAVSVNSGRAAASTGVASVRPKVDGYLPEPIWVRLGSAFRNALGRVQAIASCSALFTSRRADGAELLRRASFADAVSEKDRNTCARGAAALTEVRGRRITLCPRFGTLAPSAAALVLIHETLHLAGMGEKPPDPAAPTSAEINLLVKSRCNR